jgi:hypothetical protein
MVKILMLTTIHKRINVDKDSLYSDVLFDDLESIHRSYLNSDKDYCRDIDVYYVCAEPTLEVQHTLIGDTLFVKCNENRLEGLVHKMISAFTFFLERKKYDYVIRTTTSSFKNIPMVISLCEYFSKNNIIDIYDGNVGYYNNMPFVRGDFLLMSRNVVQKIIELHASTPSIYNTDDLHYAQKCSLAKIAPTTYQKIVDVGPMCWHINENNLDMIGGDITSVKVMCEDRKNDVNVIKYLVNKFYNLNVTM